MQNKCLKYFKCKIRDPFPCQKNVPAVIIKKNTKISLKHAISTCILPPPGKKGIQ